METFNKCILNFLEVKMKVGIPKGLLYYKYYPFMKSFFEELGAEIAVSPDTNKLILDYGVKHCVDEACLPVKVFHGHVAFLREKCDIIFVPRIMQLNEREFICPKFCGLPEMIINSIPDLPEVIGTPIYAFNKEKLYEFAKEAGSKITKNSIKIKRALNFAISEQTKFKSGIKNEGYKLNVALVGHPYNIYDTFINMNLVNKLNKLGIGVVTEENVDVSHINEKSKELFKRPFWTFAKNSYGYSTYMAENKKIDGIVYISSFACGIDSVILELIKNRVNEFPLLLLKIDEHTGEAGLDTRVEAFVDMLERSC
jgi:predicted nucleotide-binding protein (sugar kinase/HSP70/actin superfamily)